MLITCETCGTLYAECLPHAMDYDAYYTESNLEVSDFVYRRLAEIVAGFAGYRQTNRLLEIGFGSGAMLRAAARAGWGAEGVEISRTATEHARGQGFKVSCGDLSEAEYPSGHFDVVIASELLEHLNDLGQVVTETARILRPGGLLWATTPNIKGLSSRLLGLNWTAVSPDHLHLFSQEGITSLLLSASFRRVRIDTRGVNPFELWQALLHRKDFLKADLDTKGTARINSGCQLNEALSKSGPRRALKKLVDEFLRFEPPRRFSKNMGRTLMPKEN